MCMERMVSRIFIVGNLGEKSGKIKGENSMKIIQNVLMQHIHDYPVHFLSDANKDDFAKKKAEDEMADNCVYVVENLNFQPEEFGYIMPDPPVVVEKAPVEEVKEETSQPKDSKGKPITKGKDDSKNQMQSQPMSEVVEPVQEEVVEEEP